MSTILLDLRSNALRVLVTDGMTVKFARTVDSFSGEAAMLGQIIKQVRSESGLAPDRAHIIIPADEVSVFTYKLQNMSPGDLEKVIRRKLITEVKIDDPVFHFRSTDADKRQRTYLVELVRPEVLQKYAGMLKAAGLRLRTVSTSFNSNIRFFSLIQGESPEVCSIFDIDNDALEVTILLQSEVIYFERISLSYPGEAPPEGASSERLQKMKLYRIMDSIYKVHQSYAELYPDNQIQKILLCGIRGGAEGVAEALREAVDAEIVTSSPSFAEGLQYSALFGLNSGIADSTAVNFHHEKPFWQFSDRAIRIALASAVCLTIVLLLVLLRGQDREFAQVSDLLAQAKTAADMAQKEKQTSAYQDLRARITQLEQQRVPVYTVMKRLSNGIPEPVYAEKISFRHEMSKGMLSFVLLSKYHPSIGRERIVSRMTEAISGFPECSRRREPVIAVVTKDKEKVLRAEFQCEAYNVEKKN